MGEDDRLTIGEIVGTHGIKGHLKVLSHADSVDFFPPGKPLVLKQEGGPSGQFPVVSCRQHKGVLLLALEGIESVDVAEQWRGAKIYVDKASLPPTEPGSFYWYQIIGLKVFTLNKRCLGHVEEILPTGSNDVYVVRDGKKEVLIPAIDSVVVEINLEKKFIKVDLPEGLED
ncbi:MAG: 16S rRNA processing protein RimM [Deltaproteobacteria bacterium]|nr:16S rRNA processing protein RimM [Deltaproteobacteria bacterium]MBW2317913.1 16S rRNA processing protein RimM [Deltaproteobacteria bacterium]MBW2600793.1 16S rRNA processing protein RimM [Deltaproteobacteria bacterium]OEU46917.1 MAG: 16S rRNA processing protein RimM [Desulfobacterales bacterium S7086C20]